MTIPLVGDRALPHGYAERITEIPPEMIAGQHLMLDWDASVTKHGHLRAENDIVDWLAEQSIIGLSIATANPLLQQARGLEGWQPRIYGTRLIRNPQTGRRKMTTKAHVSFYTDAACQEGLAPSQITLIDNSYLVGGAAAGRAGCRVILLQPLTNGIRPESTMLAHRVDRWRLGQIQQRLGRLTADSGLLLQKTA
jgi:hypothetical protein